MKLFWKRYLNLNIWVKIVFWFCLWGGFCNTIAVVKDITEGGLLLRLHLGFCILYISQVVFIMLQERLVWVLAVLQGLLALLTNADFTFMPFVRVVTNSVSLLLPDPSLESVKVYRYLLVSLSFTLQMLSAYILFSLLPKKRLYYIHSEEIIA